jgi:hypothetical protein
MEPFSESDDEMAQKLMKEIMPSNYRMMRKRQRAGNDAPNMTLSASIDSTLRMPPNIARKSLGIKKLEPSEIKEK